MLYRERSAFLKNIPIISPIDSVAKMLENAIKIEGDDLVKVINDGFNIKYSDYIHGVYMLFTKNGKLLYVGKTVNIKNRLKQHVKENKTWTNKILDRIHYIKFICTNITIGSVSHRSSDAESLLNVELSLIRELKPMFNGSPGTSTVDRHYGYENLREELNNQEVASHSLLQKIDDCGFCFVDTISANYEITKEGLNVIKDISEAVNQKELEEDVVHSKVNVEDVKYTKEFFMDNSIAVSGNEINSDLKKLRTSNKERFSGIYSFFDSKGNVLYVGKSNDVSRRIGTHMQGSQKPMNYLTEIVHTVRFIDILGAHHASLMEVENEFIRILKPLFNGAPCNQRGVKELYGFENLRKFLDSLPKDIDSASRTKLIKNQIEQFTSKVDKDTIVAIATEIPPKRKEEKHLETEKNLELIAVRDSIKIIVKNVDDEKKADEMIEGLLSLLKRVG
jgi:predicted GIY-YIG superfamily endonuclease